VQRELIASRVVASISVETIRKIFAHHKLKPWRIHSWMSQKVPRDSQFAMRVQKICNLYTRRLGANEMVLSLDEKTNLQPRPRLSPTLPARPGLPIRLEHEYRRLGALHLFAAFDTRTGWVYGRCSARKRQGEFIEFLKQLNKEIPRRISKVHVVLDNVGMHYGEQVQAWLAKHPRFTFCFTPVHCSWMNQVEQWFGILQRKRFRLDDFSGKEELAAKLHAFITEWNKTAHPFQWTKQSFEKVLNKCQSNNSRVTGTAA